MAIPSIGAIFVPYLQRGMNKQKIIVVGGGASGLMAANLLADHYEVVLLEASSRLGGRILSQPLSGSTFIIEGGAEFIHGHQALTIQVLKSAGIAYVALDGNIYRKEKGNLIEQTEMIPGWDELLHKMKKLKPDMTVNNFLQQYFAADEYADLRRHVNAYAEGYDLADTEKASTQSLFREWTHEEEDVFRIPAGYGAMIDYLRNQCESKGCRILTNHSVKQVDWSKNDVKVYAGNGHTFSGDKLIVTIPINILASIGNKYSINFTPPLDNYVDAARKMGTGEVIKIFVHFRERCWKEDMSFLFSDEIIPTWWTQLPHKIPLLCGWIGGPKARQLSNYSDEEILEKALLSLASILSTSRSDLDNLIEQAEVFNWQNDRLNLHGYSYDTLQSNAARQILKTPVADTIFFAGEGVYEGNSPGTVEAALVSGREVANMISFGP